MKQLQIDEQMIVELQQRPTEQLQDYIQRLYKTISYLVLRDGYSELYVVHDLYVGYVASMIKERMGFPYEIQLREKQLREISTFPEPIIAMKVLIDADHIWATSYGQKKRLLTRYNRDWIVNYEMKQSGLTLIEAEQRYSILIGNKTINESVVSVQSH